MDAKLLVVGGKASKGTIDLKLPTVIGRGRDAGLKIAHPMISRRHAELFEQDGLLMLRDLGSLNGTLLDGRRVKEAPLPPEAEFTIGPLTFRAQYEYGGDLAALPAAIFDERESPSEPEEPWSELPAFEPLAENAAAETALAEELPVAETPIEETAPVPAAESRAADTLGERKQEKTVEEETDEESTGDPFDDFLNDLMK